VWHMSVTTPARIILNGEEINTSARSNGTERGSRFSLARFADKIEPFRSIRGFPAERVERFDCPEMYAHGRKDAFHWKSPLVDSFVDQPISMAFFVLEDSHIPDKLGSLPARYFDGDEISVEPALPSGSVGEPPQLANSVHVKDKKPATVEMTRCAAKGSLPIGEAKQVIHRVEHTDDNVESPWQVKVRHLLPEKLHVRKPLLRDCEHRFASIQSGDFVFFG